MMSRNPITRSCMFVLVATLGALRSDPALSQVNAWEGSVTVPTYPWKDDVNPKFWALETGTKLSTTVRGAITYPYTMQDHLSRTKVDRQYKALYLENEYLKIICLPELGGRLHSVVDKTENRPMFHLNRVVKPGMIAMRGAWASGGVEWNSGPHGHTVTCVSPVDALIGRNDDGSAFIEISNLEQIFRTRWTVRVTLHPATAYLDQQIRIFNPTDGIHPYYFWNCTAVPNRAGTRFIYPMSLATDHYGREFFNWPVHEGQDLSWLKNHETWTSIFSVDCQYGFFGSYDVDADRGVVQVANPYVLPGKKAWTWGTWDFGLVSQANLTDDDGPYIEVQSGPLPTQSDYGTLMPRAEVSWREWWYPVHGLGDGFEYATRHVAAQTSRADGDLKVRLLATRCYPGATCTLAISGRETMEEEMDLSPRAVQTVTLSAFEQTPVEVTVRSADKTVLARFTTPLPIPKTPPPERVLPDEERPDELSAEQLYLLGRKYDRATDRLQARKYFELALARDAGHAATLRELAVLDLEAALYKNAIRRLEKALGRDPDDGGAWYFLGVCHLRLCHPAEAIRCGYQAARHLPTTSLGYDLVGRAHMRAGKPAAAIEAFAEAVQRCPHDSRAETHLQLALYACGRTQEARHRAAGEIAKRPTSVCPRAVLALTSTKKMDRFAREVRAFVGEDDFEIIEASLVFADLGLLSEAAQVLRSACVEAIPQSEWSPLPLYYLAYYKSLLGEQADANRCLKQAAGISRDFVFASRPETEDVLRHAITSNPGDPQAHFQLGNLYANFGRVEEAVDCWQRAVKMDESMSVAWRNLGLASGAGHDNLAAAEYYRQAIDARPGDQTLFRDLAEILINDGKRSEAIRVLKTMPYDKIRRADILIMLAQAYVDEKQYTDAIELLESTPYFVNWEGQTITWDLFHRAHIERGRQLFDQGDTGAALADFEAALTYPENIGVGRSNRPQEASAQYWRGKAMEALGRLEDARTAWKDGAAGHEGSEEQEKYRRLCSEMLQATQGRRQSPHHRPVIR